MGTLLRLDGGVLASVEAPSGRSDDSEQVGAGTPESGGCRGSLCSEPHGSAATGTLVALGPLATMVWGGQQTPGSPDAKRGGPLPPGLSPVTSSDAGLQLRFICLLHSSSASLTLKWSLNWPFGP